MLKVTVKFLMILVVAFLFANSASAKVQSPNILDTQNVGNIQIRQKSTGIQTKSIVMPNGKKAEFTFKRESNGTWVTEKITFENGKTINCSTAAAAAYRFDACRDAAVEAGVALAVCAISGGASAPCIIATAKAAYSAYKCWESTREVALDEGAVSFVYENKRRTNKNQPVRYKSNQTALLTAEL